MLSRLYSFIVNLYENRYMIRTLAVKDIRRQYTGSFLGVFWAVIQPVAMALTYYLIFSFAFGAKVQGDYGSGSFAVWLLCGLIPWFYFNSIVLSSANMIIENQGLVTKTLFPSEVFPVISLISNSLSHLVGILIIFVVVAVTGGTIGPYALFVPVYFLLMCVMILGFSWLLSSLNVFVRDARQVVTIAMTLWFFYTPIFWPISIIPEKYRIVIYANPFYHVAEGYRVCLMAGRMPSIWGLLYLAGFSFLVFGMGGVVFKRLKPAFADVL